MARHFDAIVVGSGLGGLTAGALFARSGARVLVLECSKVGGGAATVYRHGPLAIEASLHEIDGLAHYLDAAVRHAVSAELDMDWVNMPIREIEERLQA